MSFFGNIQNLDELKAAYRRLALKYHPDRGGSTEQMQELNSEFYSRFKVLSIMGTKMAKKTQTASTFRSEFYTQNGWKGQNYDLNLTTKEITKLIREGLKLMFPTMKWSVSFSSYSGGSSIRVALMEAPFDPFVYDKDRKYSAMQINQYHIDADDRLTDRAKETMKKANELIKSYRYDDSDGMIDYFDTNFYYDLYIGRYDRSFKVVEKTDRIGTQANPIHKKVVQTDVSGKYDLKVNEDVDTRDNSRLFVVKLGQSLNVDEFKKLVSVIKSLGGYYSKFKKGFIFRNDPTEIIKPIMA